MKSFFRTVLATMLGLLLFQLLGLLIVVVIIAGVAASGGSDASFEVESGSILHLRLDQAMARLPHQGRSAQFCDAII